VKFMNILYKYCDSGGENILKALELKLPYLSDVNDPLECLPLYHCSDDIAKMKDICLSAARRRGLPVLADFDRRLEFQKEMLKNNLVDGMRDMLVKFKESSCLLSVSEVCDNSLMWAHYADMHKGIVIGIDFDKVFAATGMAMRRVVLSKFRVRIDALSDDTLSSYDEVLMTKSEDWAYERECRQLLSASVLDKCKNEGLVVLKDFRGKQTWFLVLNPLAISEVVFGLRCNDGLKERVIQLQACRLRHLKLMKVVETDTFNFGVEPLDVV
jgi:hypothetical protein